MTQPEERNQPEERIHARDLKMIREIRLMLEDLIGGADDRHEERHFTEMLAWFDDLVEA
jgi:hypothetical protein